jgi:hypothetical protein
MSAIERIECTLGGLAVAERQRYGPRVKQHVRFCNAPRIDATREQVIDDFLELDAADALELALLANFCWIAPLVAHELVEASDEKRERARAEVGWWIARTRAALELM